MTDATQVMACGAGWAASAGPVRVVARAGQGTLGQEK